MLVHLNEDSVLLLPRGISFQLTCFTLLVTGRNPFGGTLGDNGDPAGPHRGKLCWFWPPRSSWAPCLVLGPLPFVRANVRSTRCGATQRNGSITCFSRQEGWTYFYPKRRMKLDCQDLSELVLTRCRLFKCLCDYMLSVSLCVGSLQFH